MMTVVLHFFVSQVVSLLYTNNGMLLLALRSNAIHNLWKRQCSDTNLNGKVRLEWYFSFKSKLIGFVSDFF
jgi:hypothetical protein